MDLKELKEVRFKELDKKYKPVINAYNDTIDMVNSITINDTDTIDIVICKLYIVTNTVSKTLKLLSDSNYRINNRKVNSTDISELLCSISKSETNPIKIFAKKIFISNKKKTLKFT